MSVNTALVFIKPHASNNKAVIEFTQSLLETFHVDVKSDGSISPTGEQIDAHYSQIARTAMELSPRELDVSVEKKAEFESRFGTSWSDGEASGVICNYCTAQQKLGDVSPVEVERLWREGNALRLGSGLYIAAVKHDSIGTLYVINGFYGSMRHKYIREGASIHFMVVEFAFSWKEFRAGVIGATDPAKSRAGSIRAQLLEERERLGLERVDISFNGIHASAGPVEAARERMVWLGSKIESDPFGCLVLNSGVEPAVLQSFLSNQSVTVGDKTEAAFDLTEDIDTDDAVAALVEAASNL